MVFVKSRTHEHVFTLKPVKHLNSGFNRRRKLKVSFAHPCLFISFYHLLSLKTAKEATIFILPAKCTIYTFE